MASASVKKVTKGEYSLKINKALLVIISLILVTTSAVLLEKSNNSSGAIIDIYEGDFQFSYDDSGSLDLLGLGLKEVTLVKYLHDADSVSIPNSIVYGGDTYLVTAIGTEAFYEKSLTTLSMGDYVRYIGTAAFMECMGLKRLDLKGVTEVGYESFTHCTSLIEIRGESLVTIGAYAFALWDRFQAQPYPGPGDTVPYIDELYLPNVKTIGEAAFGARSGTSVARDFGTIRLPGVQTIGDYAFAQSKISELRIPNAQTIGRYAFFLNALPDNDEAAGYEISLTEVSTIGNYAFTGRAITSVALSPVTPYTIGTCAFESTNLLYANLGMVTSIGTAAFDGTKNLEYFTVAPGNPYYASFITSDASSFSKGERGALYKLDAMGDPITLVRLPPGIKPLLMDHGNKFVVADGVTSMEESAFSGCPSIAVDLNGITDIPDSAFANSYVTNVIAKNVTSIGISAFNGCSLLSSFDFIDAGPLDIGRNAFHATRLGEIYLPKNTTVGIGAFSMLIEEVSVVGVWGDTVVTNTSFYDTTMTALMVSSDAADPSTVSGAKDIFDNWNAPMNWTYGGSNQTGLLMINNSGNVDISGLVPTGQGMIQLMQGTTTLTHGSLQFVENKDLHTPPFHMVSIKAGIYWAEQHGSAGSPIDIKTSVDGLTSSGKSCYAGDGATWELRFEYYEIIYYSFPTDGDHNANGIPDGEDPDYVNPLILSSFSVGDRTEISRDYYLSGSPLKSMQWPTFVRYGLMGWYVADDPTADPTSSPTSVIYSDSGHRVTANSAFGTPSIPEEWIVRDPVTDLGTLNLFALFIGKEYKIELEARLTGGQTYTGDDTAPNATGGKIVLTLDPPVPTLSGFDTGTTGKGSDDYPYGTHLVLTAIPNPGYAFVGWSVIDIDDDENPAVMFVVKDDRSYVQAAGTALGNAVWEFDLPLHMKYVAYFAKITPVTFNNNDATGTVGPINFVVGDRLVETNNDYNGYDYEALLNKVPEGPAYTGKGTSYYPGITATTDLTFGGWYSGATRYAGYDELTDTLTDLVTIPNVASLTLKAKWYATVMFYPSDGTNIATLTGTGVTEITPAVEYKYVHDVGDYVAGNYSAVFNYGTGSPPAYAPTPTTDVNFNGWYVLGTGGHAVTDILAVAAGSNSTVHYPDIYPTKERFESGSPINKHMSLIALYTADVEFYFNDADAVDLALNPPPQPPYVVTVPVSEATLFGDAAYFTIIDTAMASAGTYKYDSAGANMVFMGWYESADGSTMPVAGEEYPAATPITSNIKLIAGWGVEITFTAAGLVGTITDQTTSLAWVPGDYGFTVLEGTVFDFDRLADSHGTGMPRVVDGTGTSPTAWGDMNVSPNVWFMHNVSTYTYSVELTPGFNPLFEFNIMGGTPAVAFVMYQATDTFADVLNAFFASIYVPLSSTYLELTKADLYYMVDPNFSANAATYGFPSGVPNALWYKDDGDPATSALLTPSTPIVYVGNSATLVQWNMTDVIGSDPADAHAYIRWLADVEFELGVDPLDVDAGTSPTPPPIEGIDEGTPFADLASLMPSVPIYNSFNDKTFKGWQNGLVKYAGQDGAPLPGAPDITKSITLSALWGVEVKFYYTGSILPGTIPATATLGNDPGIGNYVIIDVVADHVTPPSLAKPGFWDNYLIWYYNGFTGPVDVNIPSLVPSSVPGCFDPSLPIYKNKVVYARWYAEVSFDVSSGGTGFFTTTVKYLLEGSKLSDLLDPMDPTDDLSPFRGDPSKSGWNFIGWFDQTGTTGYEDLGLQYFKTDFAYLPGVTPVNEDASSLQVTKNLLLKYEYVVLVEFDSGYDPGVPIDSQYLRVNQPLPDSTSPRFTDKPSRAGVTFMGWFDLKTGLKYTENVRDSAEPNTEKIINPILPLTAAWLVTVNFYELSQYLADGLQLNVDGVKIVQDPGPDGILGTDDDFFEMAEGTMIRQFIVMDPFVTGKVFVSWFVEQGTIDGLYEVGDVLYGINDRILADITLTAGYGFIISFDTNGGIPSVIPDMQVIEGQSLVLPERPAKGRLTFNGWDDGTNVYDERDSVTPTTNTTYTAKWLVKVTLYDGISLTPILAMEWDEDVGPNFTYTLNTDANYGGGVVSVEIVYTDPSGTVWPTVTLEKYIDKYDFSLLDWVEYYSVFDGWFDPFTGASSAPTDPLQNMFMNPDSMALFAKWKERVRFYDDSNNLLGTNYVDTGTYLGTAAPIAGLWADVFGPTQPLNPATYRIQNSSDFLSVRFISVTFDAGGGAPAMQVFNNVISGTMVGAVPYTEPTRGSMYFAGWYDGGTKYSFTDKLYNDITLTAMWQSTPVERYTVFAAAYTNATIIPQGMIQVMAGDNLRFDFYVDKGYTPVVRIDGSEIQHTGGSYIFNNIRSDHSIEIFADDRDIKDATAYLTVHTSGKGDVMYSTDNGATFISYTSPLPLFAGAEYLLKAVPKSSSYFSHWSGDASGNNPEVYITSDGAANKSVTANFGSSSGFGIGSMAIVNLMCMILAVVIGMIALAVAYKRNYEGTGTGKGLRFGAVIIALIAVVLFFLTEGFGGTYVTYDEWSIVMAILTVVALILALVSMRYDYIERD
ncbi:MAG: leucine-rich repeat protein [Methanomassiliicoccaceae archaeon]|nr:leucine-rich repeat protein [Methanomassiliicoccaceae archaeon]